MFMDVCGCLWMVMGVDVYVAISGIFFCSFFGEAKLEMFTQDQYILRDKIATSYSGNPPLTFL